MRQSVVCRLLYSASLLHLALDPAFTQHSTAESSDPVHPVHPPPTFIQAAQYNEQLHLQLKDYNKTRMPGSIELRQHRIQEAML